MRYFLSKPVVILEETATSAYAPNILDTTEY